MMRYDRNFAYFRPHADWDTFIVGIGYVPTDKAPADAIKAMQDYNSYSYGTRKKSFTGTWLENSLLYLDTGEAGRCPKCNSEHIRVIEHEQGERFSITLQCEECGAFDHFDGIK